MYCFKRRTTLCLWLGHEVCLAQFWHVLSDTCMSTVKPALNSHSIRRQKLVFKTHNRLMQVKSVAECSKGSILQYFRPSLSNHLSLRPLVCLFLSGRLRQVLLYFFLNLLFYRTSYKMPCPKCSLVKKGRPILSK